MIDGSSTITSMLIAIMSFCSRISLREDVHHCRQSFVRRKSFVPSRGMLISRLCTSHRLEIGGASASSKSWQFISKSKGLEISINLVSCWPTFLLLLPEIESFERHQLLNSWSEVSFMGI